MLGLWVNAATIILGALVGSRLRGGIPEKYKDTIGYALALCVLTIGIQGAIQTENMMLMIISAVVGVAYALLFDLMMKRKYAAKKGGK